MTESKAVSRKVVKTWHITGLQVGIYDHCTETIKLWDDRVTVKAPYVKWIGNTGGYAESCYRLDSAVLVGRLKTLAQAETDDDADYTEDVREIVQAYIDSEDAHRHGY